MLAYVFNRKLDYDSSVTQSMKIQTAIDTEEQMLRTTIIYKKFVIRLEATRELAFLPKWIWRLLFVLRKKGR